MSFCVEYGFSGASKANAGGMASLVSHIWIFLRSRITPIPANHQVLIQQPMSWQQVRVAETVVEFACPLPRAIADEP